MTPSVRRIVLALLFVAVLRGLLYPIVTTNENPGPDGYDYLRVAREFLAEPFPWRTALDQTAWAPGWPAAMAVLFRLVGDSMAAVRVANALMWVFVVILTYRLVHALFDRDTAILATTLVAWDNLTHFIKYSNYEVFLAFLVTAVQASLLAAILGRWVWWMGLAGFLSAVACLCQGKCVLPLVTLGLGAAVFLGPRPLARSSIVGGLVFLASFGLTVLPYAWRTYLYEGRFSFVANVGAPNLVIGNGPHANGEWTWTPPEILRCLDGVPEAGKTRAALGYVWGRIVDDPGRFFLELVPMKFHYFWGLETVRHNVLLALMVLGIWLHAASLDSRPRFILWVPIAYFFAIHMAFYGFERYRYPILPGIHAFVALALLWIGAAVARGRGRAPAPAPPDEPVEGGRAGSRDGSPWVNMRPGSAGLRPGEPVEGGRAGSRDGSPWLDMRPGSAGLRPDEPPRSTSRLHRRAWALGLALPTIALALLGHRAMRPRVVYARVSQEAGKLQAVYWSTVDEAFPLSWQRPDGDEAACGPTARRVHCCYYTPLDHVRGGSLPTTFLVRSKDRSSVLYRWSQKLP